MSFAWMFALTGTVQGWVLWGLWHALEDKVWPATEPVLLTALLYAALAVPLVIYCTQHVERLPSRARWLAVALFGLLYGALGGYTAWVTDAGRFRGSVEFEDALAALVLGFVSLGLLCGFDFSVRRWRYARLFHYAWRNGILMVTAGALAGAVWMVLFAGAGLMSLIGVKWVMELIRKPVFIFPVTGLVAAGAFALGLARAGMTETIRRFVLSIYSWLLPLVLFFAVLWVLALPFTGLEPLFKTRNAASLMLAFTVLAVLFANAAFQDGEGERPYPKWLSRTTQGGWLAMLAVVGIAWWALGMRIAQHGWSEQRLWAALVAVVAGIYALGYALSWLRPQRWMQAMAPTNIVAALVACLGLLAFLSPLADVRQLAVSAHLRHVAQEANGLEPDWNYLRWRSGRFGRAALRAMADGQEGVPAGQGWEKQATSLLAQTSRYEDSQPLLDAQALNEKFDVHPKGQTLPESFVRYAQDEQSHWALRNCLRNAARCPVWLGDLDGDRQSELLLFDARGQATVFVHEGKGWRQAGNASARGARRKFAPEQLDDARTVAPLWQDLEVGGQRLRVWINR